MEHLAIATPRADADLELPPLFELRDFGGPLDDYLDTLYAQYRLYVCAAGLRFRSKPLTVSGNVEADGRDSTFWHLTTDSSADPEDKVRTFSLRRCAHLPRVWTVLEALSRGEPSVCWWRENETAILVAPLDFSLVVVLRDQSESVRLVTAYPIDAEHRAELFDTAARAWTNHNHVPTLQADSRRRGVPHVQRVLSLNLGVCGEQKSNAAPIRWEDRDALARRLGVSPGTVDRYRRQGLPACKLPSKRGRVLFDPHEVDAWLKGQRPVATAA
jgi:hypothetical protein